MRGARSKEFRTETPSLAERAKRREMLKESAPEALLWLAGWAVFWALSAALGQTRPEGWDHRWAMAPSVLYGAGMLCQTLAALVVTLVMLMALEPEQESAARDFWNGPKSEPRAKFWGWVCLGSVFAALAGCAFGRFALKLDASASAWAVAAEAAFVAADSASCALMLWALIAGPRASWRDLKIRARALSQRELPALERGVLERAIKIPAAAPGSRRSPRL